MTYELRATHAATRFYGRLNCAELLGLSAVLVAAPTAALFFVGLFDPVDMMLDSFDSGQRATGSGQRATGNGQRPASPGSSASHSAHPHRTKVRRARSPIPVRHLSCTTSTTATAPAPTCCTGSGKSTLASGVPDGAGSCWCPRNTTCSSGP